MRKYLYLALAAASATVLAAPVVAQAAPTAHPKVLTVKKVGGTPVRPGAALKASLAKGATATFTLGSGSFSLTITCKSSSFTAVVIKNPTAPGTATESISAESFAKCKPSLSIVTIGKIKALHLPYNSAVSDAKGFPVTVSERKKSAAIEVSASGSLNGQKFTCTYQAAKVIGNASNKGSTITIKKQKFTAIKGAPAACISPAFFSAKYGPVLDTSLRGNPAVFVN